MRGFGIHTHERDGLTWVLGEAIAAKERGAQGDPVIKDLSDQFTRGNTSIGECSEEAFSDTDGLFGNLW